ncbi:MAG TPA: serpin family protein [Puia sp.]|nr:serpin family protein [Puia sp.]
MAPRTLTGGLSTGLILCFALTFTACHKTVQNTGVDTPLDLPAGSTAIIDASNEFAVKIFQQTWQTEPSGTNTLISPLSIYLALDMTYNGAAGSTADSMAATLQLSGIPLGQLNAVSHALLQQLPKEDSKVQLNIANAIWYATTFPAPASGFTDSITHSYHGALQSLDFTNPGSLNTINSWVSKNTAGKIPKLLNQLNPTLVMLLVNAIYFNGSWLNGFQPGATQNGAFSTSGGNSVVVPYMNQTVLLRLHADSNLTMVEMPYGTGKAFDMYLVLPASQTQPINSFISGLSATNLDQALSSLDSARIALSMPKWEYSYAIDNMQPELTAMGMGIAFGNSANFSAMYPGQSTAISQVTHKTYISVSENGTTAAAVTDVGVVTTVAPAILALKFDRPFVYLIRERSTGMILFIGVVNDPSQQ